MSGVGLSRRAGIGLGQLGNVDRGLGLRDGAVVDLDFGWFAEDQQMRTGFASGWDNDALSDGVGVGADGERRVWCLSL